MSPLVRRLLSRASLVGGHVQLFSEASSMCHRSLCHRSFAPRRRRQGVAAVEFAVCIPVIVLLIFGSIEASSFIFLRQSLSVAAYEGVREAARDRGTNAASLERVANILQSRRVADFTVDFPGGDVAEAERGDEVVVVVSAPTQSNSPLAGQFVSNRLISARVVMVKE